ncbi:MAG TPA: VOC family protein, partial [Burkholderiaceae bacterium]|nr:VOC family protein [Burkholderiaceae bacterium]
MTDPLTESPAQALRNAMRAVRCLDYTIIFARDLAAMRRFYGETLGFTLQRELSARWIEYRIGSNVLALTVRGNGLFDDPP